jgi:hypothetical protein
MLLLLPIILTASHIVLAANQMPEFNIEPSCRAVAKASVTPSRDAEACKRDELTARTNSMTNGSNSRPRKRRTVCH